MGEKIVCGGFLNCFKVTGSLNLIYITQEVNCKILAIENNVDNIHFSITETFKRIILHYGYRRKIICDVFYSRYILELICTIERYSKIFTTEYDLYSIHC